MAMLEMQGYNASLLIGVRDLFTYKALYVFAGSILAEAERATCNALLQFRENGNDAKQVNNYFLAFSHDYRILSYSFLLVDVAYQGCIIKTNREPATSQHSFYGCPRVGSAGIQDLMPFYLIVLVIEDMGCSRFTFPVIWVHIRTTV